MHSQTHIPVSGYCPYLKREHEATATLIRLEIFGDMFTYTKSINFSCAYSLECHHTSGCPLYRKAQQI